MRISDWSSDVCSSDLGRRLGHGVVGRYTDSVRAGGGRGRLHLASGLLRGFYRILARPVRCSDTAYRPGVSARYCRLCRFAYAAREEIGMSLLKVSGLSKSFGGNKAVDAIDFTLEPGELLALIGPNGAGKSTTFNMVGGQLPASAGSVRFDGIELLGMPSRKDRKRTRLNSSH